MAVTLSHMGYGVIQRAVRGTLTAGQRMATPVKGEPFILESIDDRGVVLLLGAGGWHTRLSWECLEGIVPFLRGRGWTRITGSGYSTNIQEDTLDGYLKRHVLRATAGWVAVLLEKAGVVEIDRSRPAKVRLRE